jgi:O-antigen ligase
MTVISTNLHTLGGVHSEYFGPLVESGLPGFIIFFVMILILINTGMKAYHQTEDKRDKLILLSALLGLITYLSHGVLNNYLDQDKTATLFWLSCSILVATDIKSKKSRALPMD